MGTLFIYVFKLAPTAAVVVQDNNVITLEFQRQKAKVLQKYFKKKKLESFVSGIGNWMADEVLYQARIHPQQTTSNMSKKAVQPCSNTFMRLQTLLLKLMPRASAPK